MVGISFADSTQQYNKIFLNPFYTNSMSSGVNYTFNVTVNPPDGVSRVISAIISWNAQINGQTQNFTLWVNGKTCVPTSYSIATAFSATGNAQFYFDCSNQITRAGVYNVTLRSDVNTGAMTGWLDLTYMNNPVKSLVIGATEYIPGQNGKIFVEFLNTTGTPINNGTCFATVYKPDDTVLYNSVAMTSVGSNGLYYYDFSTPSTSGIYMVSVVCMLPRLDSNSTVTLLQNDTFSNITGICSGSGFGDAWEMYGTKVYDSSTEPEYTTDWNNFLAFVGATTSGVINSSSYLINKNSSISFNEMDWRIQNIYGTPAGANWVYNVSICPTTKGNLTLNATFGADCEGPITTLYANANKSCILDTLINDRRNVPLQDYTMDPSKHYIITNNYVSNGTYSGNSFWNVYSSGFYTSYQFRRVLNASSVTTWQQIPDIRLYMTNATIINGTSCYSGSCLRIADNSYAQRQFDASNANSVNITFYAMMVNQGFGDSAEIDYYDGTWHTIRQWGVGDLTSWTFQTISLGSYHFGANIIRFQMSAANGSKAYILIDNLQVYQDVVSYFYDNQTIYVTARGGSEIHVSPAVNTTNCTLNASDVWNYSNRTLTDYNQSAINNQLNQIQGNLTAIGSNLTSVNNTVNYWGSFLNAAMISINVTLNSWGNSITSLINSIPAFVWNYTSRNLTYYPAVNITNYTINITNYTNSITNYTLNLTNYTINLTNYTIVNNITNYTNNVTTYLLNLTNYTINLTNYTNNITNYTLNLTNATYNYSYNYSYNYTYPLNLTVLNQTVDVTVENNTYNYSYNYSYNYTQTLNLTVENQTVNVTDYLLNLTNYTINVTDYLLNLTNYTLNLTNYTLNLTLSNYTNNVTTYELNLTNYTINVTNVNVLNQTVNVTNTTVNPEEIWNYSNRTLTDYNQTGILNAISDLNVSLSSKIESVNTTMNFWFELALAYMDSNFTSLNSSVNNWGNYLNETIHNLNMTCPQPIINLTTNVVNVTNYTLNISQPIIEITNYTLNLTNYTIDVVNITPIISLTNYTLNVTQPVIEITNYTVNVTNYTNNITLMNYTVEVTNYTLNMTDYILNLSNYTVAVTDYLLNLTNYTINVTDFSPVITNYTLNITNVNYTYNYSQNVNLTCPAANITINGTAIDNHAIAVEVLREFCYYGAIDIYDPGVCQGPTFRGQHT